MHSLSCIGAGAFKSLVSVSTVRPVMFSTREDKKCGRGKALGKPGFPGTDRDEDDEEEEEEEGFDEDFMQQMDALKRACQMHVSVTCCCFFFFCFFFCLFLLFFRSLNCLMPV
jgi:hypothetical protein